MRGTAKLDVGEASATSGMSRVQKRERDRGKEAGTCRSLGEKRELELERG